MPVESRFKGIFLDYDTGKNTFFGLNVNDYLTQIGSKPVGNKLLTQIGDGTAPNNPAYNVLIKPMGQAGESAMYFDKRFTRTELRSPTVQTLERDKTVPWGGLKMGGGVGSGAQPDDWSGAQNGTGCSSSIVWNSSQTVFQDGVMIPHFILLAHELIHCLHNLLGTNKGEKKITVGSGGKSESIKHEEVYCVGLGDYAGEEITENAIRAEWPKVPHRATYG
jgi:hypothetical protein